MAMPTVEPRSVDTFIDEEIERLARLAVELRATRVYRGVLPFLLLVSLAPSWPRLAVLSVPALAMIRMSKREPERLAREGFSARFIIKNARAVTALQTAIFLVTGALGSPILPGLFVFTFVLALAVGAQPERRSFLFVQCAVPVVLLGAHLAGLSDDLAPAWMYRDFSTAHACITATIYVGLVYGASRLGLKVRRIVERIVARVADTRAELLDAHRTQAEELASLSGAIAHELKNPLASVKGLAGLLARDLPDGKPAERLAVLRGEVDRMQTVLEEFLTFSRPLVPLTETMVDLRAMCDDVAALHEGMLRERRVRIGVDGAGAARLDARKTRQVLINLVQNAVDASPPGETVHVHVETAGEEVCVTVADAGPGPDSALGPRLFEPGVTTKATGNGLGLTIARTLARQQGGDVTLERGPSGALATVRLPRRRAA